MGNRLHVLEDLVQGGGGGGGGGEIPPFKSTQVYQ